MILKQLFKHWTVPKSYNFFIIRYEHCHIYVYNLESFYILNLFKTARGRIAFCVVAVFFAHTTKEQRSSSVMYLKNQMLNALFVLWLLAYPLLLHV